MRRDYYKDADFYGDIDVRLQDYHNHSREWGFVDRIPEEVSVHVNSVQIPINEHTSSGVGPIAEQNARGMNWGIDTNALQGYDVKPENVCGDWDIAPESEAKFLGSSLTDGENHTDNGISLQKPFPIGDEV